MRAVINLEFEKIGFFTVNEELLKKNPKLMEVTRQTTKKVCEVLVKSLKDLKIKAKADFELFEK